MDREKVIKGLDIILNGCDEIQCEDCCFHIKEPTKPRRCGIDEEQIQEEALALLKEQEVVVHPEPSCEMTYITDCCCDLCGVQLIREDNFCRCCGKRIEWEEK